ncbi:MAG: bacteriohemerythrin [Candidatus Sedimenticola sp. (ex Thyasira tokunagai)]
MKKIFWEDEFSVGVEELDRQHQKIIEVINSLIDKPRILLRFKNVSSALMELTNYVSEHFLLEERLLQENGYPDLLEHSKKHTAYSKQISHLCKKSLDGKSEVPHELLDFLTDWWINHILHEDMQYKAFFEEKGVK